MSGPDDRRELTVLEELAALADGRFVAFGADRLLRRALFRP